MPTFSDISWARLQDCDHRLISIMNEVILFTDFSILCGYRDEEAQEKAVDDGYSMLHFPNSPHNVKPSKAVDIAPYHMIYPHIRWHDREAFHRLAGAVMYEAHLQNVKLRWGGDWQKLQDLPHFEIVEDHHDDVI